LVQLDTNPYHSIKKSCLRVVFTFDWNRHQSQCENPSYMSAAWRKCCSVSCRNTLDTSSWTVLQRRGPPTSQTVVNLCL
jgi:hypothetical protein